MKMGRFLRARSALFPQRALEHRGAVLPTPPPPRAPAAPEPDNRTQAVPQRRIRLGAQEVAYSLTRVKRRSIGMLVGTQGLEVRAPRWVALHEIESALLEKADWIVRKLDEMQQRDAQLQQARIDWRDGCVLPYLGQPLRVAVCTAPHAKRASAALDRTTANTLVLTLPASCTTSHLQPTGNPSGAPAHANAIEETVQAWMKQQARAHFQQRLDHFAPLLGVQWHTLSLSNAQTRWGSAGRTREGRAAIRLNWRLMQHRPEVVDYVVVHELSHLRVMDHSPRFWNTVASVMPDYAHWRRILRDEPLPPWS